MKNGSAIPYNFACKNLKRQHRRFQVEEGDHISMLNAFEAFEECERDRKFTNKRFLNHRALVRVGQIRAQLAKFIGRWKIEETSARENVFPVLKVDFFFY